MRYPHDTISSATSKNIGFYLWYISEELVGLASFDSRLSVKMKRLMLVAMDDPALEHPPEQPKVKSTAFLSMLSEKFSTIINQTTFSVA